MCLAAFTINSFWLGIDNHNLLIFIFHVIFSSNQYESNAQSHFSLGISMILSNHIKSTFLKIYRFILRNILNLYPNLLPFFHFQDMNAKSAWNGLFFGNSQVNIPGRQVQALENPRMFLTLIPEIMHISLNILTYCRHTPIFSLRMSFVDISRLAQCGLYLYANETLSILYLEKL